MTAAPPPFKSKHEPTSFVRSALHAWDGLLHTVVHQRNMRMHVVAALLVAQVGQGVPLGLAEKVTLIFCVMMVFFAEMLNTAIEQLVDLATEQLHEKARVTKDAAAAGVAVLAIGTVVIFAAILVHDASTIFANLTRHRAAGGLGRPAGGVRRSADARGEEAHRARRGRRRGRGRPVGSDPAVDRVARSSPR